MCVERVFEEKRLKLVKAENLNRKTVRQLIFEICSLREEQIEKFERINCRLKKQQKKIDYRKIRKRLKAKNREKLFEKVKERLKGRQKREQEKRFKEIRRRLEKKGYFKELKEKIEQRQYRLSKRSACTFPVLCKYIHKYEKANKK